MRCEYDALVIGGGPAGTAAAIFLARQGRSVALVEREHFPREKLCGEFLSPGAWQILDTLGCLDNLYASRPAEIRHSRLTTPTAYRLRLQLPGTALGLSRAQLDTQLLEHAKACGVESYTGTEVVALQGDRPPRRASLRYRNTHGDPEECTVQAGVFIGAYGRRSRLDRTLGRRFRERAYPYVGFKCHQWACQTAAGEELLNQLRDHVELHSFAGGYCGMTLVEADKINVCMLLEKRFLKGLSQINWQRLTARIAPLNPILEQRFAGLQPVEPRMHAVAEIPFCTKELQLSASFFIGDAAAVSAPFVGTGQAIALQSAKMVTELLETAPMRPTPSQLARLHRQWLWRWYRRFGPRLRLAKGLQSLLLHPLSLEPTIRTAARLPGCVPALVHWIHGES